MKTSKKLMFALFGAIVLFSTIFTGCKKDEDTGSDEILSFESALANKTITEKEVSKVLAFNATPAQNLSLQKISVKLKNTGNGSMELAAYADNVMIYINETRVASASTDEFDEKNWEYSLTYDLQGTPISEKVEISIRIRAAGSITEENAGLNTFEIEAYDLEFKKNVNETTVLEEWEGNTNVFNFTE